MSKKSTRVVALVLVVVMIVALVASMIAAVRIITGTSQARREGGRPLAVRPLFATPFTGGPAYNSVHRRKGGGMMTVVYVDSVFILNGVMDYLLLLVTARLAGIPLRRRRYLLAALAGAAYAVAVFLPGMGFLSAPPVKAAAGVLMALIAYGGETRLARLTLLFFALSCALAGSVLALGLLAGGSVPVTGECSTRTWMPGCCWQPPRRPMDWCVWCSGRRPAAAWRAVWCRFGLP